ncbi:ead/Ea22-like family protein [Raoultella ornithinolytica]|uniref:ead/Ea22-like family protein n=1 Tax=Raoultella ornithinolytica TaxID=54291 RepID=UPI0029D851ED|nr:ead/Ea22-like family protein [Raoultella ornithinolytica]MDX7499946.1 ead/Ea22-like family protein [Raoultella ornithinolytica]
MTTDTTELAQSLKAAAEKAQIEEGLTWFSEEQLSHEDGIALHKADAEFIAMANPANTLALVEALEKAQQYAKERDAENQDLMLTVGRLRVEREELESRTVKLPPELYTIGELIRTQDNRITDQPMFVVFQKREIIGSDEHSPSRICWVWDGEEVSELRAKRLEALYQDGRDTRGYERYAMQEVDEFVTACFTEHGCKDFLRQNGHNLRQPYIYACGSFRNNEYQMVRNWLAGIKVEAE